MNMNPYPFDCLAQNPDLPTLKKKPFVNIVGKGENTGTLSKTNFNFSVPSILLSATAFNVDQTKILLFDKELLDL